MLRRQVVNDEHGEVGDETRFHYRQQVPTAATPLQTFIVRIWLPGCGDQMTSDPCHVTCSSCGQGRVVHAEYSGGEIVKGSIVAAVGDDGQLDMRCAEPPAFSCVCSRLLLSVRSLACAGHGHVSMPYFKISLCPELS